MREIILNLLLTFATVSVPVLTIFIVELVCKLGANAAASTDNISCKALAAEVTEAVTTAVTFTSQTYVDALKKDGTFGGVEQMAALKLSLEKAASLLSDSAKSALEKIYGDLNEYLTTRIEAEVRSQKQGNALLSTF